MIIGLIADDFTRISLEMEEGARIINLSPKSWGFDLRLQKIDVLVVESAWLGFKGKWQRKIANYDNAGMDKQLQKLVDYCNRKKIPTIFWNKEDPVNYDRFKHNLQGFKVCLTTEENMVPNYKTRFDNFKDISVMPFFFQPKIHNPQPGLLLPELEGKIVFCGGLYAQEFPERAVRLEQTVESLGAEKVVIYDRFKGQESGWDSMASIKGLTVSQSFSYDESKAHYQSGIAQINVNTVDGSKTMYSRRMIELLACGAKVIDVTNHKRQGVLSPFVIQVSNKTDTINALDTEAPLIDFDYLVENYSTAAFINKLETYI